MDEFNMPGGRNDGSGQGTFPPVPPAPYGGQPVPPLPNVPDKQEQINQPVPQPFYPAGGFPSQGRPPVPPAAYPPPVTPPPPQSYYQPVYQQPYSPVPQQNDRRGMAIAAMVLGIISVVMVCLWYVAIPCGILGIVFGCVSLKSSGHGMALAGIICGSAGLVFFLAFLFFALASAGMYNYY